MEALIIFIGFFVLVGMGIGKLIENASGPKCPWCHGDVRRESTVCRHCQRELPPRKDNGGWWFVFWS